MTTVFLIVAFLLGFVCGGLGVIILALHASEKAHNEAVTDKEIDQMAKDYIADAEKIEE